MKNQTIENTKKYIDFETINIELIERYQNGEESALIDLITYNEGLVTSISKKFAKIVRGSVETFEDIKQVGYIGLIKAAKNFDISKKFKFSTFATPVIQGEIKRHLTDNTYLLKINRETKSMYFKLENFKKDNPNISNAELSKIFNISLKKIEEIFSIMQPIYSIYQEINEDESLILLDKLAIDNFNVDSEMWIQKIFIEEASKQLTKKEQEVIKLRFFNDMTQEEVAEKINSTQSTVYRLEKKALEKLRIILSF